MCSNGWMPRLQISFFTTLIIVGLTTGCISGGPHAGAEGSLLRPRDCLSIRCRGVEFERVIDSAGEISLPYHVQVHVAGLMCDEAHQAIERAYSAAYLPPRFLVLRCHHD